MRPKSIGGSGSAMKSPSLASGVAVAGELQRDLGGIILGVLDDFQQALEADLAGLGIDVGADVGFRAVTRAGRLLDGVGHRGKHDLAIDDLFTGHGIRDLQKLKPVRTDCHCLRSPWSGRRNCRRRWGAD
jgi:hypothetical protein